MSIPKKSEYWIPKPNKQIDGDWPYVSPMNPFDDEFLETTRKFLEKEDGGYLLLWKSFLTSSMKFYYSSHKQYIDDYSEESKQKPALIVETLLSDTFRLAYLSGIERTIDEISRIINRKTNNQAPPSIKNDPTFRKEIKQKFNDLFKDKRIAASVIRKLYNSEYIDSNMEWIGLSKKTGELREAFHALMDLGHLKPIKEKTGSVTIFYQMFGLIPAQRGEKGYISMRALTMFTYTDDYNDFMTLFESLPKAKN